jgi:hypothetical protein
MEELTKCRGSVGTAVNRGIMGQHGYGWPGRGDGECRWTIW